MEITKLSSKGQIVIPKGIREELHVTEGTPFAVIRSRDMIILKKIKEPKVKSWEEITKSFRELAKKEGWKRADVNKWISKVRKEVEVND